jgi:hypothetical protein
MVNSPVGRCHEPTCQHYSLHTDLVCKHVLSEYSMTIASSRYCLFLIMTTAVTALRARVHSTLAWGQIDDRHLYD